MLDWFFDISTVMVDFFDYLYKNLVKALSSLFLMLDQMTVGIYEEDIIKAIVLFFSHFGWTKFTVGFVIAVFELPIEMQNEVLQIYF